MPLIQAFSHGQNSFVSLALLAGTVVVTESVPVTGVGAGLGIRPRLSEWHWP